ncbi:MAG: TlpA family protein disulfide reductase [Epsilonproteobacteria bacterium]|nr:MAG: TlpA family protein disulfide reductase [Campylobacterota bacterium]
MKKIFTLTLLLFLTTSFTQAKEDTSEENNTMTMTDTLGKTYEIIGTENGLKIKGLEGKVVFLEFFGYRCPPCIASIPNLIELQDKYKDKLAIVSIEVQGYTDEQLAAFVKSKKMNYIVASEQRAFSVLSYIQLRAGWNGSIPFLVVTDGQGDVKFIHTGMLSKAELEELILKYSNTTK